MIRPLDRHDYHGTCWTTLISSRAFHWALKLFTSKEVGVAYQDEIQLVVRWTWRQCKPCVFCDPSRNHAVKISQAGIVAYHSLVLELCSTLEAALVHVEYKFNEMFNYFNYLERPSNSIVRLACVRPNTMGKFPGFLQTFRQCAAYGRRWACSFRTIGAGMTELGNALSIAELCEVTLWEETTSGKRRLAAWNSIHLLIQPGCNSCCWSLCVPSSRWIFSFSSPRPWQFNVTDCDAMGWPCLSCLCPHAMLLSCCSAHPG